MDRKPLNRLPLSQVRRMVENGTLPPYNTLSAAELRTIDYVRGTKKIIGDLKAITEEFEDV